MIESTLAHRTQDDVASVTHDLENGGVRIVIGTFLDNSGVFRAKQVPVAKVANQVNCTVTGDVVMNDGNVFLLVSNGDASPHSVSVTPSLTSLNIPGIGQITKATVTQAVGASDEAILGPFPQAVFNNASGQIAISYTAITSMKIMAVRISRTQ